MLWIDCNRECFGFGWKMKLLELYGATVRKFLRVLVWLVNREIGQVRLGYVDIFGRYVEICRNIS